MKTIKIQSGKVAVIKKDGNTIFAKKANKKLKIECGDNYEIIEKSENKLTGEEKGKLK